MAQRTLIYILINAVNNYPFPVKLDRCVGNCNIFHDLSNKIFIPNKTEE